MKVALYARVSKALQQNPENQFIELRRWAKVAGHEISGEYFDEISSKDTRPEKEKVLRMLRLGEIDGVAFWSLDRWGRTLSELVLELEEFSKSGKAMISMKEGIDLSSAAGRMVTGILAVMANFERDRIRERTLLGLARAKAQGKRLGRKPNGLICECTHSANRHTSKGCRSCTCDTPYANLKQFILEELEARVPDDSVQNSSVTKNDERSKENVKN